MKTFKLFAMVALVMVGGTGLLPPAAAQKEGADKRDLERFQGKWAVVSMTIDGKTKGDEEIKDQFRVFKGAMVTGMSKDKEIVTGSMKIDPTKSPAHIDATFEDGPAKGTTLKGIYEFEGDGLTICYGGIGKDRPTVLTSKPSSGASLVVLKRAK
jgi:uncharacterized protein (TIGR03067 family)